MTRARDPFGIALNDVRTRLRAGVYRPGEPLIAADIAETLAVSVTPVREALARVAGEGLIDDRRGRGYSAHRLDLSELEDLYGLHLIYAVGAVQRTDSIRGSDHRLASADQTAAPPGDEQVDVATWTESFFSGLVRCGENHALTVAMGQVAERLAIARGAERAAIPNLKGELQHLIALWESGDSQKLIDAIHAYHDRRVANIRSIYFVIHGTDR